MTQDNVLDRQLLEQYHDSLGTEGLNATLTTFDQIIQSYANLLHQAAKDNNEEQLRSQAHKVKGACNSVGLVQLAKLMEQLEKESWEWPQAERLLIEWADSVIPHRQQLQQWVEQEAH
jgi:HPt (histidine-containing phosphotransfer) domain-containing protein